MRSLTSFIAVLLFVSAAWVSASEHCPADFNGDGQVNAADLAELLAAWGPCEVCGDDVVEGPEECDPPDDVTCDDNCKFIHPTNCCFPHAPEAGCVNPDCESTVCEFDGFCCIEFWDGQCAHEAALLCPECFGLDCCFEHPFEGCTDPNCQSIVCTIDNTCCFIFWGPNCAELAADNCEQCPP